METEARPSQGDARPTTGLQCTPKEMYFRISPDADAILCESKLNRRCLVSVYARLTKGVKYCKLHGTPREIQSRLLSLPGLNEGERQRSCLTLQNSTRQKYAFKVKTTSPKSYIVKPSVGFVEPDSSFKIYIIKQGNTKPTVSDKFLIEALPTNERSIVAAEAKIKAGNKDIRLIKVPVVLDADPAQSPMNSGSSSEGVIAQATATLQSEASFPPTPSSHIVPTQSPSRGTIKLNETVKATAEAQDGLVCLNNNITFHCTPLVTRQGARTGAIGSSEPHAVSSIRLYNPTEDRYAFKVDSHLARALSIRIRSTFPRGFKVKPPQGFVKPRTAVDVEVVLLNPRGVDFSFAKFLVQSFVVDFSDEVITDAMYHKAKLYKAVRETDLAIKLVGFEDRPESEIASTIPDQDSAAAAYEIRFLRKQLFHMESELQSLKQQVKQNSARNMERDPTDRDNAQCAGCIHVAPLFRFRKHRRNGSN